MTRSARWVAAAVVAAALTPTAARADQIDRVMIEQADQIAKAIRTLDARHIAVLKFDTKLGNAAPSFNGGVTNGMMAKRLENLLILTNDSRKPLMVLTDAGQAVTTLARQTRTSITWKTEAGRASMFKVADLPLAWDERQKFAPDGYVTGEVVVTPDMRNTEIVLYGFTKGAFKSPRELYRIKDTVLVQGPGGKPQYVSRDLGIATDRTMLARMGQSFVARKSRDLTPGVMPPDIDTDAPDDAALRDKTGKAPVGGVDLPVKVEIFYDGKPVQVQDGVGGEPRIALPAHPQAGQKVSFRLTNTSPSESFAVLLAVNGRNTVAVNNDTLMGGAVPEAEQKMWALGPGQSGEVHGFYVDLASGDYQPFEVLPEAESEQQYNLMNGNDLRGMISVRVFGKREVPSLNVTAPKAGPKAGPNVGPAPTLNPNLPAAGGTNLTPDQLEELAERQSNAESLQFAAGDPAIRSSRSLTKAKERILAATRVSVTPDGKFTADPKAKARYLTARSTGRGLIIDGSMASGGGEIKQLKVEYDPLPIANWEWVYYTPGAK